MSSSIRMPASSPDDFPLDPVLRDAGPTGPAICLDAMDVDDRPISTNHGSGGHDVSISTGAWTHNDESERNIANNRAMLQGLGIDKARGELDAVMGKPGKENYRAPEKPQTKTKAPAKRKGGAKGKQRGGKKKKKGSSTPGGISPSDPETIEQVHEPSNSVTHSVPTLTSNSTTNPPKRLTRSAIKSTWVNTEERLMAVSPDQSKWMKPALEALVGALGPAQENGVVDLWLTFETSMERRDLKKLTADGRPWQLSDWLARGRKYQCPPPIDKAPAYASAWRGWWSSIQPAWRTEGATWPMLKKDVEGEKWVDVMKGGASGIFLAILSVSWWFAQCGAGNERDECEEAIMDICWVLERMIEARKTVEEESDRPAKRYVPNLAICLLTGPHKK